MLRELARAHLNLQLLSSHVIDGDLADLLIVVPYPFFQSLDLSSELRDGLGLLWLQDP